MDEDSVDAAQGCAVIDGQFVLPVTMTLFTVKGCGESRVVHGHRVAQHPLVAAGDSGNHL